MLTLEELCNCTFNSSNVEINVQEDMKYAVAAAARSEAKDLIT
jgi:hypothetical protein